jgi:anthranilate phosphoribosyltransferase
VIQEAIKTLVEEQRDLSEVEAGEVMREIMRAGLDEDARGDGAVASEAQFGAFVTALRIKGETADEITGMAKVMREHALPVMLRSTTPLLDTAGTGGSSKKLFNASTAAAFVAAAGGARVAKHGNRAMTSRSGSADLLEALGAQIALTPAQVVECIETCGVGFMFAQSFHPAMRFAGPLRPQIGIRTVFNILGPLTNPAGANCHVMGTPNEALAETMAQVLSNLGMRHALVVTGSDGLDDITVTGPSTYFEVRGGQVTRGETSPFELGLSVHDAAELQGGTAEENAELLRQVLRGEGPRAVRDLIVAQAAAGLYVTGLASSLRAGAEEAGRLIDSGDAAARVGAFVEATRRVSAA